MRVVPKRKLILILPFLSPCSLRLRGGRGEFFLLIQPGVRIKNPKICHINSLPDTGAAAVKA